MSKKTEPLHPSVSISDIKSGTPITNGPTIEKIFHSLISGEKVFFTIKENEESKLLCFESTIKGIHRWDKNFHPEDDMIWLIHLPGYNFFIIQISVVSEQYKCDSLSHTKCVGFLFLKNFSIILYKNPWIIARIYFLKKFFEKMNNYWNIL